MDWRVPDRVSTPTIDAMPLPKQIWQPGAPAAGRTDPNGLGGRLIIGSIQNQPLLGSDFTPRLSAGEAFIT